SQNLTFKVLASTGFRAPTAWESFNATRQRKANPDLRPERMRSLEVGVGYRFFEKYYLSVHQYYTRISDLLLEVETNEANPDLPGSNYNQNQNVGRARIYGTEVVGDFQLTDTLHVNVNYTYSEGYYRDLPDTITSSPSTLGRPGDDLLRDYIRETQEREIAPVEGPIPNIASHHANAGFTWYVLRNLSWNLRANYVDIRRTIASNPERTIEGYVLWHTNLRYEDAFGVTNLFLNFLIKNLTDEAFYDPGIRTATGVYYPTRHPIEGRNFWLTLGYRF
ncbi:MAG: TonB-dependent receptor, partial [Leptospiraceae bacterium]|nr:TonB-dependent receptor [Leptospiraceae bacterium]